jgi:acetylornithine/LysW-gamma-L-lysine aminotransferase
MPSDDDTKAEDSFLANVYQKFPIHIMKGKGAIVYDEKGYKYIDCMGGYGVSIIGHCHPRVIEAIHKQSKKILTCHSSFYNEKRSELLKKLIQISPPTLERVFLSNSGAESIECALKVAAKYTGRKEIVSMIRGYHGKTLGALSATWNPKYRKAFQSFLIPHVKFIPHGSLKKAKQTISDKTAAVIVEPIQGESGVRIAPQGFLKGLRELCNDHGAVLIVDEVQSGFGRTGKMWSFEHWNIIPDIMCIAKAMGGGLPIGATIAKRDIMDSLVRGEHSSTFGGNPLACAAACATIDIILKEKLIERAQKLGEYFIKKLQRIKERHRILREVRGLGLMIGVESRFDIYNILIKALEKKVILLYSGRNIIRFLPPLVIEKKHLNIVADVLEEIIEDEESNS